MEAGKVINNVIIFGGIGAMAYLLFKKKPVIEQKPTTKIFINGIEKSEYDKQKAKLCLEEAGSGRTEKIKDCVSLQDSTELTEPLIDRTALTNTNTDTWSKVLDEQNRFYTPTGDLKANSCLELDLLIKDRNSSLVSLYELNALYYSIGNKQLLEESKKILSDAEAKFNKFNCRDKIEAVRTRMLVDLQSKGSIKAEESVVGKGFKEQKTYIILGALVLLTGFYIVVKK